MAKKLYASAAMTKLKDPRELFVKVTIGATGAPTLVQTTSNSLGIASVTRSGAGTYVVTMVDPYAKLLFFEAIFLYASAVGIAGCEMTAETVASTKTITFITKNTSGTATDPANGAIMYLRITLDECNR